MRTFETKFSKIGGQQSLRCGPNYRTVWDVQRGSLIDEERSKFPLVYLGEVLHQHDSDTIDKGRYDQEYKLVELEAIEQKRGRIIEEKVEIVQEINSTKVVFGDCDLLFSKLRPYLGKAILNPDRASSTNTYIGSTELVPFTVSHDKTTPRFIQYLLLTDRFLDTSELLMYGKEHPRISIADLRHLKVPLPDLKTQQTLSEEISELEDEIQRKHEEMDSLQQIIDDVFVTYNLKEHANDRSRESPITFQERASHIGNQKFLRCGALYRGFYNVFDGLLFDQNGSKYSVKKLGEIISPSEKQTVGKGELDESYILVDLKDIEQYTGRITTDEYVDTVGSDKVVFGDADLIISKIDPYLGYIILNEKEKPYIGSSELIPFDVDKDKAKPEFVRYLLLSNDYLRKSEFLMYGKRHPRIHTDDLLHIRVPCPDLATQNIIVNTIESREDKNRQIQDEIDALHNEINVKFWDALTVGDADADA